MADTVLRLSIQSEAAFCLNVVIQDSNQLETGRGSMMKTLILNGSPRIDRGTGNNTNERPAVGDTDVRSIPAHFRKKR